MSSPELLNCEKVRELFEGREAIYIEKGALRVRVADIRYNLDERRIDAQVEEIPTKGLERTVFHAFWRMAPPVRWKISAGFLSCFSDHYWAVGYGGWQLYFAPEVVKDVVRLAASWPDELDAHKRYEQALDLVLKRRRAEQSRRVFPDGQPGPEFPPELMSQPPAPERKARGRAVRPATVLLVLAALAAFAVAAVNYWLSFGPSPSVPKDIYERRAWLAFAYGVIFCLVLGLLSWRRRRARSGGEVR